MSCPARKTRRELLTEWRHEEVLEAARRIFARLGYAVATVEEIAKEAGMAKGAFEERLSLFLNQNLGQLRSNKALLSIFCADCESRGSPTVRTSKRIDKPFFRGVDFMRQCLARAIADGEIREVPIEPAALTVLALARALLERHLYGWTKLTPEEDVASTRSLIMSGLRIYPSGRLPAVLDRT